MIMITTGNTIDIDKIKGQLKEGETFTFVPSEYFPITFSSDSEKSVVNIPIKDMNKLAELFNYFLNTNGIDSYIENTKL